MRSFKLTYLCIHDALSSIAFASIDKCMCVPQWSRNY